MNGLIYPSGLDSQYGMDDHNYMPCFDHGMFMAPLMSLNGPLRFSCQSLRPQAVDGVMHNVMEHHLFFFGLPSGKLT